jgi:hypothetical protein
VTTSIGGMTLSTTFKKSVNVLIVSGDVFMLRFFDYKIYEIMRMHSGQQERGREVGVIYSGGGE